MRGREGKERNNTCSQERGRRQAKKRGIQVMFDIKKLEIHGKRKKGKKEGLILFLRNRE